MKEKEIERLFHQYYAQMTRLAITMLYDDEEARDVVSEVFATFVKLDIMPKNVEGYLMTSVRNRCLNLLQHKSVRARFEQAYALEVTAYTEEMEDTEQQFRELMTFARQNLTKQTLLVFEMRHLQGMKYQEIADELGISRVMVYKHLAQAMETIRKYQHIIKEK
jgi:RNA polymerase sigma-70 factor (ECF subfamily)